MSWESTAVYYRLVNRGVQERLGGLNSARVAMVSVNFEDIAALQRAEDWDAAGEVLAAAGRALEAAGADFVLLCTNTMHCTADAIITALGVPFVHIADPTAEAITAQGLKRVGLLGTHYTMEQRFYLDRLGKQHGLEVIVPDSDARDDVHDIIFNELCQGTVRDASRERYREIMASLVECGADCIVLGCTEIGLLVDDGDATVPIFDTTRLHAERAVSMALA